MWLTRTASKNRSSSSKFACSSFKDIYTLCAADEPTTQIQTYFKKPNIFHRVFRANAVVSAFLAPPKALPGAETKPNAVPSPESPVNLVGQTEGSEPPGIFLPGTENQIVVYFTSLRVVRRTFEDCKAVRLILRSLRVSIDERDVSMDGGFTEELQRVMGVGETTKLTLPRVFIGGRYIGGAKEIRQLHETGQLKKMVKGLPPAIPDACQVCSGHRFILCDECNGSHKCYREKGGFRSCTACNENGLIRCPSCSGAPPVPVSAPVGSLKLDY
ncbi:PREDICTED: uncharacterized protein At5g39865-like [Ipomoea nil]|uniref:uncharacterized protein At5g39865-like n=1 Tax=Ipomoea nil TaxID=35883 RepID=UPI000901EB33|nr:PREDICTED: uncharacterized protein At5g39865-like [Ipomoea nil]